jgi:hypothetical protein
MRTYESVFPTPLLAQSMQELAAPTMLANASLGVGLTLRNGKNAVTNGAGFLQSA